MSNYDPWGHPYDGSRDAPRHPSQPPSTRPGNRSLPPGSDNMPRTGGHPRVSPPRQPSQPHMGPPRQPSQPSQPQMPHVGSPPHGAPFQQNPSPHPSVPEANLPTVEFETLTDPALVRLSAEDTGEFARPRFDEPPTASTLTQERPRTSPTVGHDGAWSVPSQARPDDLASDSRGEPSGSVTTIERPKTGQVPGKKAGQRGSLERPDGPASRKQLGPDWTANPIRIIGAAAVTLTVLAGSATGIIALGMWINP
ncbi:hypothetical protein [Natronoglycomyces albus]|uniref:Uncharacterized protein n=1 Tax=Natronoglycomyces albus TaxID=2811108 RepID=A0A895XS43_9ACTN|nr:hypothetical protein [Natronoglycomyces albus]QSB06149.1 hypothetical protein JQS30_04320 [Natronoglycomyces albus]